MEPEAEPAGLLLSAGGGGGGGGGGVSTAECASSLHRVAETPTLPAAFVDWGIPGGYPGVEGESALDYVYGVADVCYGYGLDQTACIPRPQVTLAPVEENDWARSGQRRTLSSANVDISQEGVLQLHVRLFPHELIRWHELNFISLISMGSFGEVYLAQYKNQDVSVKRCILGHGGSMTKEQLHNLEREINVLRTLDHPHIVKYIGCVLEHPNLATVAEYLPNGNVFDMLYTRKLNPSASVRLKIASQVALAVCYMHSCDPVVIHRDLKTQNMVMDADWNVKLCDFGKTEPMDDNCAVQTLTDNGGSPRYMAPECFINGGYVTEKVDIWSLGCCLVEVFGGPLPYEDVPQMSQVRALILTHREPPLVPPWFAPQVKPMLAECFEFDASRRVAIPKVQMVLKDLTPELLERHGMHQRRTH